MVSSLTRNLIHDPYDRYIVDQMIAEGKRHVREYRAYLRTQVNKLRFGSKNKLDQAFNFGDAVAGTGGQGLGCTWEEVRREDKRGRVVIQDRKPVVIHEAITHITKKDLKNGTNQPLKQFSVDEKPHSVTTSATLVDETT